MNLPGVICDTTADRVPKAIGGPPQGRSWESRPERPKACHFRPVAASRFEVIYGSISMTPSDAQKPPETIAVSRVRIVDLRSAARVVFRY